MSEKTEKLNFQKICFKLTLLNCWNVRTVIRILITCLYCFHVWSYGGLLSNLPALWVKPITGSWTVNWSLKWGSANRWRLIISLKTWISNLPFTTFCSMHSPFLESLYELSRQWLGWKFTGGPKLSSFPKMIFFLLFVYFWMARRVRKWSFASCSRKAIPGQWCLRLELTPQVARRVGK